MRRVRWRDESMVSRMVSAVTGRNMLVSGSVAAPSHSEEPWLAQAAAIDANIEQDAQVRHLSGTTLGRQTYLGLARDESETDGASEAAMLASVPAQSVQAMSWPALACLVLAEPGSVRAAAAEAAGGALSDGGSDSDSDLGDPVAFAGAR